MIDLAGLGSLLVGVSSLYGVVVIHRNVGVVDRKIDTGNGKTIGQMAADAEPHHHQAIPNPEVGT